MTIFVGNLPFIATENDVKAIFEVYGNVSTVSIKKKSGKNSRGFGFVTMPDDIQAQAAITGMQDKEFMGRPLSVSMERPKPVKPKKDFKEIKRRRLEAKMGTAPVAFCAPIIPEKKVERKTYKKFSQPTGAQAWEKRKGRGTAKPWKKKPGGVNKKFKYAR
jgi:RNA recognition motif-containing protein